MTANVGRLNVTDRDRTVGRSGQQIGSIEVPLITQGSHPLSCHTECYGSSLRHCLADRLGQNCKTPVGFAVIHNSITIGILQIIRDAVTITVQWIAIVVGRDIVVADVHSRISLRHLIGLSRVMIQSEGTGIGAAHIDQQATGRLVERAQPTGLVSQGASRKYVRRVRWT